ncbi:energy transducer TonB family protein [Taklimakanibacter lacteus]|uniref:energy transducer TonB family protein n=1 Tax=Taklimakanibacter lacteus TaxID=2268456 RepID=UPI000E66619F
MTKSGLTFSSRLVSIVLAVGVHAAAAAAFMLAPAKQPPPPPPSVEIEMLAEITAETADEVEPAVVAEATETEEAQESEIGAAQTITGSEVGEVTARDNEKAEVAPAEVKAVEQSNNMPEVKQPSEIEPTVEPDVASLAEPTEVPEITSTPVELEKPVIEAPQAPAISSKPKPKPSAQKKVKKKEQRRATLAGATTRKVAKRVGASQDVKSGGRQASAQYRSVVNARLASRRPAIQSRARGAKGRVVIFFTIGASGDVISASVSQSSGNASLDSAARAVVASTSFPPPPGGSYRNGVPILMK